MALEPPRSRTPPANCGFLVKTTQPTHPKSMKIAIMQPYLFPYIGYFQLISAADRFVIHDDVQSIKGGWINRNRILVGGEPHYITLPVQKAPSSLNINERQLAIDAAKQKHRIIRQLEGAYRNAPYFDAVLPLVSRTFAVQERNLSLFVTNALRECCAYLGILTPFVISSQLKKNDELKGELRVINIAKTLQASHYFNPIGGVDLYDKTHFSDQGVTLCFLKARPVPYQQMGDREFVPFLSIIDAMMFNSKQELASLLGEYDLL